MSPRILAPLALVSVGLLGLALWEVMGEDPSRPHVGPEKGDEPELEEGSGRATDTEDEPRLTREKPPRRAELVPDEPEGAVDDSTASVEQAPARGDANGQPPTLEEAREGFAIVMEELELVAKRRRRISQKQWERHFREANDAFAALSARLRAGDDKELAELESAHELLKERLGRLRVRGKKHEAP